MTIDQLNELLSGDTDKLIQALKSAKPDIPIADYKKQFRVSDHDVFDKAKRRDKEIQTSDGNRLEAVNRIGVSLQELICERAVSFLFGAPVELQCEPVGDAQTGILKMLLRILKDNKIDSHNAEVALDLFRATEVAECWYPVKLESGKSYVRYGFDSKFKMKVTRFSAWDGDVLYPTFDNSGDMIAFSRAYTVREGEKDIEFFETYTAEQKIVWANREGWADESNEVNPIGKIPVVYGSQTDVEWYSVQSLIDRIEKLLSNNSETTDYHASPTLFAKGEIDVMPKKGEQGKLIVGATENTSLEYVSIKDSPEMVKFESETLLNFIFTLTQTPNISFEAMKGLGDISGVAFDRLFVDAKLKVKKKRRIFDAFMERRVNILLAYIAYINTGWAKECDVIEIDSVIPGFAFTDELARIETLTAATGGKSLLSQKTAVKLSGLTDDVDAEYKLLQEEETIRNTIDVTEPAV